MKVIEEKSTSGFVIETDNNWVKLVFLINFLKFYDRYNHYYNEYRIKNDR